MATYDVLIVGAGISGLSFAHFCARAGLKTLVLEKSDRVGGAIHSHFFTGEAADFWVELGAHTCYNSYTGLLGILQDVGLLDRLEARANVPFKMLVGNDFKPIASQLDKIAVLPAFWRIFTLKKQGQSLQSYYSGLVGKKNYDKVMRHAFSAVLSQPADDYPADLLFKKRRRRKDIIKKFTFAAGLQTMTAGIAAERNLDVITGANVEGVSTGDGRVSVAADDRAYEGRFLVVATPASVAAKLLKNSFPQIATELERIKVDKAETLSVAVENNLISLAPFANAVPENDLFFSIVSRDIMPHPKFRGFTFHFRPDVADTETKLKRIAEILRLEPGQLTHIAAKDNFVPRLKVGQEKITADLDRLCAGTNLFLAGNYFIGLAVEDCVSRSTAEFARLKEAIR